MEGEKRLWDLVLKHMVCVRVALGAFQASCMARFVERVDAKAERLSRETHLAEGHADDVRREVEKAMVRGELLPPSRRHILELVDGMDSLANAGEAVLDRLLVQRVAVPQELEETAISILRETARIWEDIEHCVAALFAGKPDEALELAYRVDRAETRVEHLEQDALERLFGMDLGLALKLQVASVFRNLAEISDRAEDLSDRIALIVAEGAY